MKKSVTLALLFAGAFTSAAYAQGNLFTPADCDSIGWLLFDTQEKIDKYVGDATSDKLIKSIPQKFPIRRTHPWEITIPRSESYCSKRRTIRHG